MKLTREQAIAEHRKMWNWIADERKKGIWSPKLIIYVHTDLTETKCYLIVFYAHLQENAVMVVF